MNIALFRQFGILFDRYYWQTAILIARNGLARMYRNSFLGMLWTLFQPITMVLVYTTIMPLLMKSPRSDYALYVVVSLPVWSFFAACLVGSSRSIIDNRETLKRCMISSSVFPIADVLRNSYIFFISFFTIYFMALLMGFAKLDWFILLVPLYFIPILIIIGAVSIAISFIAPYIRDIGEFTSISMTMLFWLTPIIYPITVLPHEVQNIMHFNPFFIMIHPIQELAYNHTLPNLSDNLALAAMSLLAVGISAVIFRICRRNYVYYL